MTSLTMRHRLGAGLALVGAVESGGVANRDVRTGWRDRQDRYAMIRIGLAAKSGGVDLSGGLSLLREDGSVLGARFGDALGSKAGRTLFADLGAGFAPGGGWTLALAARYGWTRAADLDLQSSSWSADAGRDGLFGKGDHFGIRLSQPLRVERGGLDLLLPVAYDYASGQATMERRRLSLSPQGRQIDAEASYGLPFAGGWAGINAYWRRQGGNIAAMPDEKGAALRYSLGF